MYRFRSVENLIGKYQELEKQQIYFASRNELNDPMEGMRHYFWQGDKIVWQNFFKHYLFCLEHVVLLSRLIPDNETITNKDIPIFKSVVDLPTNMYRERIGKINKQFFSDSFVESYLQFIINNPNRIFLEEMYVHLKILLRSALEAINEIDIQTGLIPYPAITQNKSIEKEMNIDFENVLDDNTDPDNYKQIIDFFYNMLKSLDNELLHKYKDAPKLQSITIEFPQLYLDSVLELTYPESYVACFMDNCLNSSIWGTYGVNHTGVCLKFKTDNKLNPILPLKTVIGYSSSTGYYNDFRNFPLKPIQYSSNFNELDFFKNLGRLTIDQLEEQWYTDENGNRSNCSEKMFSQEEEWRNQYWDNYEPAYLKKLPVWSHEREYRIILSSALGTFDDPENRLLEYKFEDLEAIIFGMKTTKEAKTEIIEIIKRKCKEISRNDFEFYEMAYSNAKNELYPRKLHLNNF